MLKRDSTNGVLNHYQQEYKNGTFLKMLWKFFIKCKLRIYLSYDQAILFLGISQEKMKAFVF